MSSQFDRRLFLRGGALAGLSLLTPRWAIAAAQAAAESAVAAKVAGTSSPIFVLLVKRGAMDGLNLLAPTGDPDYSKLRPTLGLKPAAAGSSLSIENHFTLHPAASALLPIWEDRNLAFVVQSGSPDNTRSHFDAQDYLETGTPGLKSTRDGFLNRAMKFLPNHPSDLAAIALQPSMPRVLQGGLKGSFDAISMNSFRNYGIRAPYLSSKEDSSFETMYQTATDQVLRESGISAFRSMHSLQGLSNKKELNEWMKEFPKSTTGRRLGEIAWMIKAGLGVQVAVTDVGGWDTHVGQGAEGGRFADRVREVSEALAAFQKALGADWNRTIVATATEFGRTAAENGTRGTDHGHGSVMMLAGGAVRGGRVLGHWSSLKKENLFEGRDVPVTTDFRTVFSEILLKHMRVASTHEIFPHWESKAPHLGFVSV